MVQLIIEELDIKPEAITYYSDSRVVLGYVTNETWHFYMYISNRVERIRRASTPEQWHYVPTQQNPADLATRCVNTQSLNESMRHSGPSFLHQHDDSLNVPSGCEAKQPTEANPEVRLFIQVLATQVPPNTALCTSHFSRFSKWITLIKAVAKLILFVEKSQKSGTSESPEMTPSVHTLMRAKYLVIQNVKHECYKERNQLPQGLSKVTQNKPSAQAKPSDRQLWTAKSWWLTGAIGPELQRKPSLDSPELLSCHSAFGQTLS